MVDTIVATQAREGVKTTHEQAEHAYDTVMKENKKRPHTGPSLFYQTY
jgi:hypothetical protein